MLINADLHILQDGARTSIMESVNNALEKFPIHQIIFILTVGIFIVISFPYDYNNLLTIGLDKIKFYNLFGVLPLPQINLSTDSFQPFVNLQYLRSSSSDFSIGVAQTILFGLPVGVLIYSLSDLYEKANHGVKWFVYFIFRRSLTPKGNKLTKRGIDHISFSNWEIKRNQGRYVNFLASVREVNTGLLYGTETLLFLVLISTILQGNQYHYGWLFLSFILCLFFGVIYLLSEYKFNKEFNNLMDIYGQEYSNSLHKL